MKYRKTFNINQGLNGVVINSDKHIVVVFYHITRRVG